MERLKKCLARFEQDNATNLEPVAAEFCLDAGLSSDENGALLIEMGYEVYTRPHSHRVVNSLRQQVDEQTAWVQECFVIFAANFIRWAAHWLGSQAAARCKQPGSRQAGYQAPGTGWPLTSQHR